MEGNLTNQDSGSEISEEIEKSRSEASKSESDASVSGSSGNFLNLKGVEEGPESDAERERALTC